MIFLNSIDYFGFEFNNSNVTATSAIIISSIYLCISHKIEQHYEYGEYYSVGRNHIVVFLKN